MTEVILYLVLGACALAAAALVYRYDLYDREPWLLLVTAMVGGAVAMRFAGAVEEALLVSISTTAGTAALAALVEELCRVVVVLVIAIALPRHFNDPMDGLVYGSVVGLGMALEESFHLLGLRANPGLMELPVELVRLFGHLVMAGIAGYGVGLLRTRATGWAPVFASCFGVAFALHFLWDWIALSASPPGVLGPWATLAAAVLMLSGMLFYGSLVIAGSRRSRDLLAPSDERSLWGWPFSALRRRKETP